MSTIHIPVMAEEVVEWLSPQPGQVLVDGTLGGGGHTQLLAERVGAAGQVIAVDRDPGAVERAAVRFRDWPVRVLAGSYADLPDLLRDVGVTAVDGVVLDLGLSSDQLADADRGFSYEAGGELDLRFDPTQGEPAWRLLERASADTIANVIYEFGEERFSRRIGRRIVEERAREPIRTAAQLARIVRACVPRSRHHAIDPATRTFQALRIWVNGELDELRRGLASIPTCLKPGGRLVVISFHSLEDRLVKHTLREVPGWLVLTKKPIRPNESELGRNPRSRSARLRAAAWHA